MKTIGELLVESKFQQNGVAAFASGSAALPGVAFTAKLNTGLYLLADRIGMSYNGSGAYTVDATSLRIETGKKLSFGTGGDITPSAGKISLSSTLKLEVLSADVESIKTAGGIVAAKNVGSLQDESLKDEFEQIEINDELINDFFKYVVPLQYRRIDTDEMELGVVAQVIEKRFPLLVGEVRHPVSGELKKTVKYDRIPLLMVLIMKKMWEAK